MGSLLTILNYIHIITGGLALVFGPLSMIVHKGSNRHRLFGKIFFYLMMVVASTTIILASYYKDVFAIVLGVFSAYLPLSAYRVIYLKMVHSYQKPKAADWDVSLYMLSFTLLLIYYVVEEFIYGNSHALFILIAFIGISVFMLRDDYKILSKKVKDPNFWLFSHISRMIGANIAAMTAFLVLHDYHELIPYAIVWFLPVIVGSGIIYYFIHSYKLKLHDGKDISEIVDVRIIPKIETESSSSGEIKAEEA